MPERSKGSVSSTDIFECVGSNPTADRTRSEDQAIHFCPLAIFFCACLVSFFVCSSVIIFLPCLVRLFDFFVFLSFFLGAVSCVVCRVACGSVHFSSVVPVSSTDIFECMSSNPTADRARSEDQAIHFCLHAVFFCACLVSFFVVLQL